MLEKIESAAEGPGSRPPSVSTKPRGAGRAKRLSREEWIDAAIDLIASEGIEALRLDVLALRLKVTKGSFYWHFPDRDALLEAIVETWRQRMTSEIAAYLALEVGTPLGRLKRLIRLSISPRPDVPGGPLESSLRELARNDTRVEAIIREVDAQRIAFVQSLYVGIGLSGAEAHAYALAHMSFVVGGRQILFSADRDALKQRWDLAEKFLIPQTTCNTNDLL
jgi:AcrR family transcriptional regulator